VIRRALACLVLLLATPAMAATRLYFPLSDGAAITPGQDAAWDDVGQFVRRKLQDVKGADAITFGTLINITEDTGNQGLDRQYVSTRMDSGIIFTSVTTTVRAVAMMRENALSDDVNQCILGIRIVSDDGGTVRATLFTVANRGPVAEFAAAAAGRNKQCADGDLVGAIYTTVLGDRLVVEVGYQTDGLETSPQAQAKYGQNATDCAENETNTTDCAGWIEFSNTITFAGEVVTAGPRRVVVMP